MEQAMSHFLDRLNYFSNPKESFSDGFGVTNGEDRTWEDAYRNRWAHDKMVRSTHGVNCTGSCSTVVAHDFARARDPNVLHRV
jgi:nitrate reductase alpha subunit